jgi:tryptophanyl-tRNA synthetase
MSLQDPTSKMSKSDANPAGFIMLTEPTDSIRGKVRSAVTDSDRFVRYDWDEKPGVSNLLELFGFFSGRPITELVDEFHDGGYGRFKEAVAEAIVAGLEPIRSRFDRLDDGEVAEVMRRGAARARRMATPELESIKRRMGLRTS